MAHDDGAPADSGAYHSLQEDRSGFPSSTLSHPTHSSSSSPLSSYPVEEKVAPPSAVFAPVSLTQRPPAPVELEHKHSDDGLPLSPLLPHSADAAKFQPLSAEAGAHAHDPASEEGDALASESAAQVPWMQVLLIAAINLNEAFQQNVIWPFIPFLIRDFRISSEANIGFYGGLLGSSFFFAQLLSSFAWGLVSDRVGRRFVLLYSTAACTMATLVFGLATTYPVALSSRFLAGFLSGSLGTAKVYLSEVLDRRVLAKGFSALGFSAGLGGIIGPVTGGYLNRPAVQYPSTFSQSGLFGQFPYLLPEMVSIAIGAIGFVISIRYLPESRAYLDRLQAKRAAASRARDRLSGSANAAGAADEAPAVPVETIFSVMKRKQVLVTTGLYGCIALVFIIFDEIFSFFFEAAQEEQGLGYSSGKTGSYLAVSGVSLIVFQLGLFPWLVERVGVIRLFRWSLLSAVPYFLLFPLLSNLERSDTASELTTFAICLALVYRAILGANLFTPSFMLINGSAPQSSLGAVNGFAQSQAALWRTIGPLIGGGVWSMSLGWSDGWAESHHFAPYAVMAVLTLLTYALSLQLRSKVNEDDPDELDDGTGRRRPQRGGGRQQPSHVVALE